MRYLSCFRQTTIQSLYEYKTYLRTRMRIISPEPVAWEHGEDGMTIYVIPSTPVVLVSIGGRTASLHLQDR